MCAQTVGSPREVIALLLCLASATVAAGPTGRQLADGVTAANVDRIEIQSHGLRRGEIYRTESGVWQERTNPIDEKPANDQVFDYTEAARTTTAVLLRDAYRGIELELDLASRKVFYSDNNISRQPIYDIAGATRAEIIDARDVRYVTFAEESARGPLLSLVNEHGGLWVLREPSERVFFFERHRDEYGVSLRDYSEKLVAGINFLSQQVVISSVDGKVTRTYVLTEFGNEPLPPAAKPPAIPNRPTAHTAMQLRLGGDFGDSALLTRGQFDTWTLRELDSNPLVTYVESGRDDWSVHLLADGPANKPYIRIDLFEMLVYDDESNEPLFVISEASDTPAAIEEQVAVSTFYPPGPAPAGFPPPGPGGFHSQIGSVVYGTAVSRVGEYSYLGDGHWRDIDIYGSAVDLTEVGRDIDTIELGVPGRDIIVRVSIADSTIYYVTPQGTQAMYDILATTARNALPVQSSTAVAPVGAPVAAPITIEERQQMPPVTQPAERQTPPVQPKKLDTSTNPRLTRTSTSPTDCGQEGQRPCSTAPAIFVRNAAGTDCPTGSNFFPFVRGGSCWSCPDGSSYIPPSDIEGPRACTYPASQSRAAATYTGLVELFQCPNGGAARGLDNKCWKCPDGFSPDILEKADGPRGCFRDNPARFGAATLVQTNSCPAGSSAELLDNGNCWKCPEGFNRSGSPPSWPDACTTNIWDATFANLGAGTCAAGLENFRGVCERRGSCGSAGGRPCEIGERVPSCDDGLREDFHSNSCVVLQPGESPFLAGLASASEFYGDSIVSFCEQAIAGLRFDSSTDLGIGANCTKDVLTGAACQYVAASLGADQVGMVGTVAGAGPQLEAFRRKVDQAYLVAPCNTLTEDLRPATNHGRASGFSCPDGQFWDPNGSCYSCPDGYSRTMEPVTGARACVDKPANELARSACAVYSAATEDLRDAVLCSAEILESGVFVNRPLDLGSAQQGVCLAVGQFAYSIFSLAKAAESPQQKSDRILNALNQLARKAEMAQAALDVVDGAGNMGTAFSQMVHCNQAYDADVN